jgi:hypothetical protein
MPGGNTPYNDFQKESTDMKPSPLRARGVIAIALSMLLPNAVSAQAGDSVPFGDREVQVLSALINHGIAPDTPIVVIADHTTGDPASVTSNADTAMAIVEELGIPRATLDDWSLRNVAPRLIDRPLDLQISYQMLNEGTLGELFDNVEPQQGWSEFFTRYAGAPGIVRVSRAGFDDSLSHALVYIEHQCGAECGAGRLVHLVRETDGGWRVQDGAVVWMTE